MIKSYFPLVNSTRVLYIRLFSTLSIDEIRRHADKIDLELFQFVASYSGSYWFYACPNDRKKALQLWRMGVTAQPCMIEKLIDGDDWIREYFND